MSMIGEMDDEANAFAMELLMPAQWLRADLAKGMAGDICDDEGIARLARRYRVPHSIMAIRIGQLMERPSSARETVPSVAVTPSPLADAMEKEHKVNE